MALTRSLPAAAGALSAVLVLTSASLPVAQQTPSPQPEGKAPQAQQVSDKEIELFAAAATEVRQLNKQWAPKVQRGAVLCGRCGEPIQPHEPWDLGHQDEDRTKYNGPEHRDRCNRSVAGKRSHRPP